MAIMIFDYLNSFYCSLLAFFLYIFTYTTYRDYETKMLLRDEFVKYIREYVGIRVH